MVGPVCVHIYHAVLATTDIHPTNLGLGPVGAGQAGSLRQGQGSKGDGDDGVHLSCRSDSLCANDKLSTDTAFYIHISRCDVTFI